MRIIRKESRRIDQNSWRKAWHEYYPGTTSHGQLTGFNLDHVMPGKGFGMHPHQNMEIVTIPIVGSQQHKDSLGNSQIISEGDVQLMSAGTGIFHSEMNASDTEGFSSYQIWIYPNKEGYSPSYQQAKLPSVKNQFELLISPEKDGRLTIKQQAWFYYLETTESLDLSWTSRDNLSRVYLHVMNGRAEFEGIQLVEEGSAELMGKFKLDSYLEPSTRILLIETLEN